MSRRLDFPVFDADNHLYETTDAFTKHQVGEYLPFGRRMSGFSALVNAEYRGIKDMVASIIGHGLATRFPDIRFMPIENGSAWVKPLMATMRKVHDRSPEIFDEDPLVAFKRSVYIHPFFEEDVLGVVEAVGADSVVFGSDYPHPEGLFDPVTFVDEIDGLPVEDQARIMGGNLARLMGIDPHQGALAA